MTGQIFLVDWDTTEAEKSAERLRALGWDVAVETEDGGRAAKEILANPPDAVLIYLARLPSHGRETAHAIRFVKGGHGIRIVFVGGEEDQIGKTHAKVPFATFTTPEALDETLKGLGIAPAEKTEEPTA